MVTDVTATTVSTNTALLMCSAVISHKAHSSEHVGKAKLQIYCLRHFQRHDPTVKRSVGIGLNTNYRLLL